MWETPIIVTLILFNIIFIAFIGAIVVFIKEYRKKKKLHIGEIASKEESHKKELLQTQIEIQTQTMQYIGQEIHDNIGQKLTLASLYAQQVIYENKSPELNESIVGINMIINQSLQDLRQLSKSLTDDSIKENSLSFLLEKECKKVNDLKQCNVQFSNDVTVELESYQIKSILYRITQEFLQNSIKHAKCKNIFVSLDKVDDSTIEFILKDDGIGFDTQNKDFKGIGLKNIRKRTELIGGSIIIESEINVGTTITLKIPL